MSVEKLSKELEPTSIISLPESFDHTLKQYPELKQILMAFANQDPASFMHSMAVHTIGYRLIHDLILRYQPSIEVRQHLEELIPFLLVHDLGKAGTDKDPQQAWRNVHPVNVHWRPVEEIAFHWLHSEIGYDMLLQLAERHSGRFQLLLRKWAELTRQHQPEIYDFLATERYTKHLMPQPVSLPPLARLVLACFRMSDTTAAAALPRPRGPNHKLYDHTYVVGHLRREFEKMQLDQLLGDNNPEELLQFMSASVTQSLGQLKTHYQEQDWLHPKGFSNDDFAFEVERTQQNIQPLNTITHQAWKRAEPRWLAIIRLMEDDLVFRFEKKETPEGLAANLERIQQELTNHQRSKQKLLRALQQIDAQYPHRGAAYIKRRDQIFRSLKELTDATERLETERQELLT